MLRITTPRRGFVERALRRTIGLAVTAAVLLCPDLWAAATTRSEDERLLSDPAAPAGSRLGSTVAISRGALFPFAVAGAPMGGRGAGAVVAFEHLSGVGWGPPLAQPTPTRAASCPCPLDLEPSTWAGEEIAVFARPETATTSEVLWWTPAGGGSNVPSIGEAPVEAIAIQEDTLVVGQPSFSNGRGRVLIYELDDSSFFTKAGTLLGHAVGERLGAAVAVRNGLVVAGAPGARPNGVVRTFVRRDLGWEVWLSIDSPASSQTGAAFGASLALALDGSWLAIGSPMVDRVTTLRGGSRRVDIGAVYLYRPSFLSWQLAQLLRPADAESRDRFGASVALHRDVLVAGAPRADVEFADAGAAYVFERSGGQWQETFRLVDSDPAPAVHLGESVTVGDLGALVGAPKANGNGVADQGALLFYGKVELDPDAD